ncbi:MAG: phage gp6-like head-tail connector protein [Rhodobacteraceae bacterium]|nr:phage gp6-like head-tail connector protein [Paracoccaceae bacterium]MBR9820723.1 phage gp6-like head-tail connector protein [Paracoccaceae bacterium]
MSQLTIAQVKAFCDAADFSDDDELLADLKDAAEAHVKDHLRRDLDAEMLGVWPAPCLMAVKLLIAHWYLHREAVSEKAGQEVPLGVTRLLAPYRDLS